MNLKIKSVQLAFLGFFFCACSNGTKAQQEEKNLQSINASNDTITIKKTLGEFDQLKVIKVIQSRISSPKKENMVYEKTINSPKSAIFSKDGSKFYVNSLEGCATVVFDSKSFQKLKVIKHQFDKTNAFLFKNNENTVFGYDYKQQRDEYNHFLGKPVESCLSHDGKFLWVTYYRRNWDPNAESPSAVAIIDVEKDEIVRVMPSGPLPKMIACSNDNKFIAVTHWGDNTVGLIDISSSNPMEFKYISHIVIDYKMNMNFSGNSNRDQECGNCLRGTVFTPDNQKILIAKMGGNGIAVVDVASQKYLGTITGTYSNLRHIAISNGDLFLTSNKSGVIQKASLTEIFKENFDQKNQLYFPKWETVKVGPGARTLVVSPDGNYVFACVNNACKIAVIDVKTMKMISEIEAAAFPVGLAISPDGSTLISTSQGKSESPGTGNTVMVFQIEYKKQ